MTRREFLFGGPAAAMAGAVASESSAAPLVDGPMAPAINPAILTGRTSSWPLAELTALGFRGLEVTPACLDHRETWPPAAERADLKVICVNAMESLRPYLTGSLADAVAWRRRATLDGLLKTLVTMRQTGIPYLLVAPSRLAENYQTPAESRALLVESLRELAGAGETTILLCAAPFRLFASSADIAGIVDEAARPNVSAALDVGHALLTGENPADAARALGARLRYVQVHDADARSGIPRLDRHLPLGTGAAVRGDVLAAIGDRPWAITVAAPDDPLGASSTSLRWIRR